MFEQILKGQEKQTKEFDHKLDVLSEDLNGKILVLTNQIRQLTTNIEDVSVVQLRSGKQLNPVLQRKLPAAEIVDLEENDDAVFVDQLMLMMQDELVSTDTNRVQARNFFKPDFSCRKVNKLRVSFPKSPKSKQELDDARCNAMIDKLVIEMPLIDVVKTSPMIRRYVKRMVTKDLTTDQGVMIISAQSLY